MADDARLRSLVKDIISESFKQYEYLKQPISFGVLQRKYQWQCYRILGREYSATRLVTWLEDQGILTVLRRDTGGKWILPTALWNELPISEQKRLKTWAKRHQDPVAKRRTDRQRDQRLDSKPKD